ncbi:hypothetical protein KI387_030820, partial [Taxus chinensis]
AYVSVASLCELYKAKVALQAYEDPNLLRKSILMPREVQIHIWLNDKEPDSVQSNAIHHFLEALLSKNFLNNSLVESIDTTRSDYVMSLRNNRNQMPCNKICGGCRLFLNLFRNTCNPNVHVAVQTPDSLTSTILEMHCCQYM